MIRLLLSRERLERIQRMLNRVGGSLSLREFSRTFSVWAWEVEQAAALGWVKIETRKPRTGRPSRIATVVSKPEAAKLPPYRWQIEKPITVRHWNFAVHSVFGGIKNGRSRFIQLHSFTEAYLRAFPAARKRRAASASMSRLLHHKDVQAARAWFLAQRRYEIPRDESSPATASAVWQRLREVGSRFAGPRITTRHK